MRKRQMKPKQWFGCYQDSWKGHITAASYAHPAKFAKGLVERILDYMAEKKWIQRGDVIGDPFGGVRTGGIVAAYRGYQWIGCELERKFIDLGEGNFELHRDRWKRLGVPMPICVQGDSRQFNFIVDAILSSPPYVSGGHHTDVMNAHNTNGRGQKMKVHAVVGSPPFLGCRSDTTSSGGGIAKAGYKGKLKDRPSHRKMGERVYRAGQDKPRDPANIEVLKPGTMAAVIASPPYETIKAGAGGLNHLPAREGDKQSGRDREAPSQGADQTYGTTPGQIAHAKKASVDAMIGSPPYADSVNSDGHGIDFSKARADYPGRVNSPARNKAHSDAANNMRYGDTPGQIGALKAVVGSPPWQKNVEGGRAAGKFAGDKVLKSKRGKGASDAAVRAQAARDQEKTIGDSPGQIGQETGETYWQAVEKVYHACLLCLKPGGVMALVVKDFCKDKKRMPLCDDTMRLLVWLGFEEVERIHAMLSEDQIHHDLFEGEMVKKKERKSFFRRNYEKNMAPDDPRRIDFEEVLIVRKPL